MSELNVEPLLLHLLINSDFCGDRWEEAAKNPNHVYQDILLRVFKRNKDKELDAYKQLNEGHFFELMEVFGMAAFRGNGQTDDRDDFMELRRRYARPTADKTLYSDLDGASLKNVALMVHSRQDLDGAGFEFVHQSFGEYLAARALLGAAARISRLWKDAENDENEETLALRWVNLIGNGKITKPVSQFLKNECNLRYHETTEEMIETLSTLFGWTLAHGFPVQKSEQFGKVSYRALEHTQKCAEMAMLVTATSLWVTRQTFDTDNQSDLLPITSFSRSLRAAPDMIDRLFPQTEIGYGISAKLSGLSLSSNDLRMRRIPNADLAGAELIATNLTGADLSEADISEANLIRANLTEADLTGAILQSTDLRDCSMAFTALRSVDFTSSLTLSQQQINAAFGVKSGIGQIRMPPGFAIPDHCHNAEQTQEDSKEAVELFWQAWREWRDAQP